MITLLRILRNFILGKLPIFIKIDINVWSLEIRYTHTHKQTFWLWSPGKERISLTSLTHPIIVLTRYKIQLLKTFGLYVKFLH